MNIYEMLKSGKTADYIRVTVENEIKCATKMIEEEEAAKKREIEESRKNLVSAFENYGIALSGRKNFLDESTRAALEQVLAETEEELKDIEHDLKEIEKLKKFSEKLLKKPTVKEKTCAVKFMTDDAIIKDFVDKMV